MRAFKLNLDQLEVFYTLCALFQAETEEQRVAIMDVMVELGEVESVTQTSMTKDEYAKHIAKHFGNVLRVSSNEDLKGDTSNGESIGFKQHPNGDSGTGFGSSGFGSNS